MDYLAIFVELKSFPHCGCQLVFQLVQTLPHPLGGMDAEQDQLQQTRENELAITNYYKCFNYSY